MLVVVCALGACAAPSSPSEPPPELANTFESAEALAQAVLRGLQRQDRAYLATLALSEGEFRGYVWPELPASRPERNLPFDYVWGQLRQRGQAALDSILSRYGGRVLKFSSIAFKGETTTYPTFTVMRDSEIVAADESGREWVLQLFGSTMVKDGRYKLFSYVVDE